MLLHGCRDPSISPFCVGGGWIRDFRIRDLDIELFLELGLAQSKIL